MKTVTILLDRILKGIWLNIAKAYKETKKLLWDHRQGIQLVFTFADFILFLPAVSFSYGALQEYKKFGTTVTAQMDTLVTLFTEVKGQISYLPTSISRFDSTVRGLNEGISNQ
jgi:hypothetical protein